MSSVTRTDMAAIVLARHIKRPLSEALVTDGWKRVKLIRFRVREWGRQSGLHLAVPVAVNVEPVSDYWELCKMLHLSDKCLVADWTDWYNNALFLVDCIVDKYKGALAEDELNFLATSLEAQVAKPPAEYLSPELWGVEWKLKEVYGE